MVKKPGSCCTRCLHWYMPALNPRWLPPCTLLQLVSSEAIVFTDGLAVMDTDLSLSGISSKICLSPPVTIRDFVVMNLLSRSNFSLIMVDDYSTDFFCFPPGSLIELISVLSAVACRRSLLSVTSGYNCTWPFWCSSELQSWTSVHPHSWGLCSSDKRGIRVRYC
jgi:hypothetical protein